MSVVGKKQDHDCPFSLATTYVVIAIFGKDPHAAILFATSHRSGCQGRDIGASGGDGGGGCSDGEGKVPPESHGRIGKT